jgi:hypothetical protein
MEETLLLSIVQVLAALLESQGDESTVIRITENPPIEQRGRCCLACLQRRKP